MEDKGGRARMTEEAQGARADPKRRRARSGGRRVAWGMDENDMVRSLASAPAFDL
jgi:hypothetical protein